MYTHDSTAGDDPAQKDFFVEPAEGKRADASRDRAQGRGLQGSNETGGITGEKGDPPGEAVNLESSETRSSGRGKESERRRGNQREGEGATTTEGQAGRGEDTNPPHPTNLQIFASSAAYPYQKSQGSRHRQLQAAAKGQKLAAELELPILRYGQPSADSSPKGPWYLSNIRKTCEAETRRLILEHHPDFELDPRVRRWITYNLFGPKIDREEGLTLIPWQLVAWINGTPLYGKEGTTAGDVLEYLREKTSLDGMDYTSWIPEERTRLVSDSGIHDSVQRAAYSEDPSDLKRRVYVRSGRDLNRNAPGNRRRKWEERLAEEPCRAPSAASRKVLRHMNDVYPRTLNDIKSHIAAAAARVDDRDYEIDTDFRQGEAPWEQEARKAQHRRTQRGFYKSVLRAIKIQHKPFYRFSQDRRTDRVFSANESALLLPSDIRKILFQDYYDVDLQSAHLNIAASLWEAEAAISRLEDLSYSVWDDLIRPLDSLIIASDAYGNLASQEAKQELFSDLKGAFKPALYSTVFGMAETGIRRELTMRLKSLFSSCVASSVSGEFMEHPVIRSLLESRKRQLEEVEQNGGGRAADGRFVPLDESRDNPAASVLGTIAQSYEMALMSVLVDYEQEREREKSRNRFRVALWLHDGAYVTMRSPSARMDDLEDRLEKKAGRLGVIARFDCDPVTPPEGVETPPGK